MTADPFIEDLILSAFTKQSERDKQTKIGPSEIGGCAYCVGHTLSQRSKHPAPDRGDGGFGYAAHIGTMCHYWMQHNMVYDKLERPKETAREFKVRAFELEGYGHITGSTDLYVPELAATFDWKFPGKWSYDKLKLELKRPGGTPSSTYRYQQQTYGQGIKNFGLPIEKCVIVFFPRHSNRVEDILFYEEAFNPQMVEAAKTRLETIWEWVQEGELAEIESDPDCYACSTYGR